MQIPQEALLRVTSLSRQQVRLHQRQLLGQLFLFAQLHRKRQTRRTLLVDLQELLQRQSERGGSRREQHAET